MENALKIKDLAIKFRVDVHGKVVKCNLDEVFRRFIGIDVLGKTIPEIKKNFHTKQAKRNDELENSRGEELEHKLFIMKEDIRPTEKLLIETFGLDSPYKHFDENNSKFEILDEKIILMNNLRILELQLGIQLSGLTIDELLEKLKNYQVELSKVISRWMENPVKNQELAIMNGTRKISICEEIRNTLS